MEKKSNKSPIILFGSLRSGTTLLRLMLNKHSDLYCHGESDFLFDYISDDKDKFIVRKKELINDRIFNESGLILNNDLESRDVIYGLFEQLCYSDDKKPVIVLHRGIRKALSLFPSATVLHIVRDPRDVARSSVEMGFSGNVFYGVEHWINTEKEWDTAKRDCANFSYFDIKYEDLIEHYSSVTNKICNFLKIAYDNEMLNYDIESNYKKPDINLVEQWKRKLNDFEISLIEYKANYILESRGYELSSTKNLHLTRFARLKLYLNDRFMKWRMHFKRFGFLDSLILFASRKLHLTRLRVSAQRRIDIKSMKYLK